MQTYSMCLQLSGIRSSMWLNTSEPITFWASCLPPETTLSSTTNFSSTLISPANFTTYLYTVRENFPTRRPNSLKEWNSVTYFTQFSLSILFSYWWVTISFEKYHILQQKITVSSIHWTGWNIHATPLPSVWGNHAWLARWFNIFWGYGKEWWLCTKKEGGGLGLLVTIRLGCQENLVCCQTVESSFGIIRNIL
jgi:hypothetical protein